MRNWPRYLARKIDRWWWDWVRPGTPYLRDGQCWMDVTVNRRDWRYRVRIAAMMVAMALRNIRLDVTIGRRSFPLWGWWING